MIEVKITKIGKLLVLLFFLYSCDRNIETTKYFSSSCARGTEYMGNGKGIIVSWERIIYEEIQTRKSSINKKSKFLEKRSINSIENIPLDTIFQRFSNVDKSLRFVISNSLGFLDGKLYNKNKEVKCSALLTEPFSSYLEGEGLGEGYVLQKKLNSLSNLLISINIPQEIVYDRFSFFLAKNEEMVGKCFHNKSGLESYYNLRKIQLDLLALENLILDFLIREIP